VKISVRITEVGLSFILSSFSFLFFLLIQFLFWDLELGFSMTSQIIVTQSCVMMESGKIFWKE